MSRRSTLWLLAFLIACGDGAVSASDLGDEMPEDLPPGSCRDTEVGGTDGSSTDATDPCEAATSTGLATSSTTGDAESECVGEEDCDGAGACVADWTEGERGPFRCQFACVPTVDESTWCSDDSSCCDAAATCTARGYCVVVGDAEGGSPSGG